MKKVRTHIAKIQSGEKITIAGHVQTIRVQSSVAFIIIRDITGTIQCVIEKIHPQFEIAKTISVESVLEITGVAMETPSVKSGIEIHIETITVLSAAEQLPIQITGKGSETVSSEVAQDWRFLTLRRERDATIMKTLSAITTGYREALLPIGFTEIFTPKLMGTPSESHAELFKIEYFGGTAYLAQSAQLYKQMAIASGLERVFEVSPTFRADPSFTTRHATEFITLECEMGYIESFDEVMETLERAIAYMLTAARKACGAEIKKHFGVEGFQLKRSIPRITMYQAKKILAGIGVTSDKEDLSPAEERAICEYVEKEMGSEFVYITEYPWESRPFYHKKGISSETGKPISISADLLYKGIELTTLAQREEQYETLCAQRAEKGLKQEGLQWYLDCFRFGMPPHGGWGMGSERFVKQLLGLSSLREAQFLFRGPTRLMP
ncbi:MAG: aspartate--tRNA(Asn) ligase [Alphaproteobacteria bacterium]|nr:aspartate--tRNA(Asn) ligase [Alphaproteobacteria bacterium]